MDPPVDEKLIFIRALAARRRRPDTARMQSFICQPLPMRVRFEAGAIARVGEELEALGLHRAIVLCTPDQSELADRVVTLLGPRAAGVYAQAQQHVPMETARQAQALAKALGADELAYTVEPKIDGVAVSLTYEHGRLTRAVTRGDGEEGDEFDAGGAAEDVGGGNAAAIDTCRMREEAEAFAFHGGETVGLQDVDAEEERAGFFYRRGRGRDRDLRGDERSGGLRSRRLARAATEETEQRHEQREQRLEERETERAEHKGG